MPAPAAHEPRRKAWRAKLWAGALALVLMISGCSGNEETGGSADPSGELEQQLEDVPMEGADENPLPLE